MAVIALMLFAVSAPLHAGVAASQHQTPAEYRKHLKSLKALIENCRQQMDSSHCQADAVGPDDTVTVPNQSQRRISYGWLRGLLQETGSHAIHPEDAALLLQAAVRRLEQEQSEAASLPSISPSYTAERAALTTILDTKEFRRADRSLTERVLEAVALWINRRLASLMEYSSHRRWLTLLLDWWLVAFVCLILATWLVRQARRARGLQPEEQTRIHDAPAMRSWERLRHDAEQAAREHRWRDAVRAYYWAAIARFESRGQWPTDRARTPREYLRLAAGTSKQDDLRRMTQCFETCWYGAETATQPDCETARLLFERLVAR